MKVEEKLSNDVELIKEIESLKLKQLLLVESLKGNKNDVDTNKLIEEIYNKIVFAFNSNMTSYEDSNKLNIYSRIDKLEEKIDTILSYVQSKEKKNEESENTEEDNSEKNPPIPEF
ncbi:MAG: hypothetical protein LAT82_02270 [Nanoarchaeota archaeon]|nr:hypothetical protein [Nanoarchaeota archaeon]